MRTAKFPKVQIRDLTLKDVEDSYQWCFDKEVHQVSYEQGHFRIYE